MNTENVNDAFESSPELVILLEVILNVALYSLLGCISTVILEDETLMFGGATVDRVTLRGLDERLYMFAVILLPFLDMPIMLTRLVVFAFMLPRHGKTSNTDADPWAYSIVKYSG